MHIKDLEMNVELDSAALAAVRGGSHVEGHYPEFPTFGGDWEQFRSDVTGYFDAVKPEMPSYEPVPYPSIPAMPSEDYVAI
ncbi:MAG: hypothetical protein ACR2P1_15320 [Pseudomonadales bacterium]